jgi:hypothetical protein
MFDKPHFLMCVSWPNGDSELLGPLGFQENTDEQFDPCNVFYDLHVAWRAVTALFEGYFSEGHAADSVDLPHHVEPMVVVVRPSLRRATSDDYHRPGRNNADNR